LSFLSLFQFDTKVVYPINILEMFFEIHLQLSQFTILGIVHNSMNSRLAERERFIVEGFHTSRLINTCLEQVDTLFNAIDFHQSSMTGFWIVNHIEFGTLETVHVSNITQPISLNTYVDTKEANYFMGPTDLVQFQSTQLFAFRYAARRSGWRWGLRFMTKKKESIISIEDPSGNDL
jgi:hypothetical protein